MVARAGSLRIVGTPGSGEVRVTGQACADREADLARIQVRAARSGDQLRVEAEMPDGHAWSWNREARLDLVISVPESLSLDVEDSSGPIEIEGAAELRLEDGSGEIDVRSVAGLVDIEDGSGSIEAEDVEGGVRVRSDGSGSIDVRGVRGDFVVDHDGNGGIRYRDVAGRIEIPRD